MNQDARALQGQNPGDFGVAHILANDETDAAQRRLEHVEAVAARKVPGFLSRAPMRLPLATS
jgi:hypothetical protein